MLNIIDPPSKKKKKELNNRPFKFFLFIYYLFLLQVTQLGNFLSSNYRCGIQIHLYQKLITVLL